MKNKVLISIATILLAIFAIVAFRGNLGIDFTDASLITVATTDNSALTDNVLADASALKNISRVERLNHNELTLYFQPISDNVDQIVSAFANKYLLSQSETMVYRFSSEEFNLFFNRFLTLGLIVMFVLFLYQGAELRGIRWKRWQVAYSIASDFFITLIVTLVQVGFACILGEFGIKMDNSFLTIFFIATAVTLIFRGYETDLIKRYKNNFPAVFMDRKPELILLACVLLLAGFLPFVVLSWQLAGASTLILFSIGINYLVAIYIKPDFVEFMFEQGKNTLLLKKKALSKEW